jgi:hypothetical protein
MYALQTKGKLIFSTPFKTEEELDLNIRKWFASWQGMQPKGSDPTIAQYLEGKQKVILTIKKI